MIDIKTGTKEALIGLMVREITERLNRNVPVLFLASGGSTVGMAVEICNTIHAEAGTKSSLLRWLFTLTLVDERFGAEGHPESNWQKLVDGGLDTSSMTAVRVLHGTEETSKAFAQETERFNAFLEEAVARHRKGNLFVAGAFGIGPDGHTAGILPESPVSRLSPDGNRYAEGYKAGIFKRITVTPAFFPHLDSVVVWAGGEEKRESLETLKTELPAWKEPAQLLKLADRVTIHTDLILEGK